MSSKDTRNGIIALIILAIGVKIILYVLTKYVDIAQAGDVGKSLGDIGNLFFYGALAIALLLVPFFLSARSNEKGKKMQNAPR